MKVKMKTPTAEDDKNDDNKGKQFVIEEKVPTRTMIWNVHTRDDLKQMLGLGFDYGLLKKKNTSLH